MIFPGSCTALGARHRASRADRPRCKPVTRAVSVSSSAPAHDTTPAPSPDTLIFARRPVVCILKVPSPRTRYDSRQVLSSQVKGTFYVNDAAESLPRRKAEAKRRQCAMLPGLAFWLRRVAADLGRGHTF